MNINNIINSYFEFREYIKKNGNAYVLPSIMTIHTKRGSFERLYRGGVKWVYVRNEGMIGWESKDGGQFKKLSFVEKMKMEAAIDLWRISLFYKSINNEKGGENR